MTPVEPQIENHLRIMAHRWVVIVGAAVVTFIVVLVWRMGAVDVYRAEGTVQLRVPVEISNAEEITDFQSRSYAEMAATPIQLEKAVARSGLDIDVDEAESRVDIAVLSTPGFVAIGAEGPSPREAEQLADGVIAAILDEVELDSAEASDDDGDDIAGVTATVLAPADADLDPIGPSPLVLAVIAALVAAIVTAEAAVLVWYLQGRLSLADPAQQVRGLLGVRTLDLTGSDPESLLPFVAGRLEQSPVILVLQTGQVPSAEVAVQLDRALSRLDHKVMTFDGGSTRPEMRVNVDGDRMMARLDRVSDSDEYDPEVVKHMIDVVGAGITVVNASVAAHPETAFDMVRDFPDAVVLVVDPRKTTKKTLVRQAAALDDVGASLRGVVLHREPRRPVPLALADNA